jgi:hypothetical protein
LLVIAAALIGGLAAAALVHTSLTIAVIVSVVAGGIAVLAAFRSPGQPPAAQAPQATRTPQASRTPQAFRADPTASLPAEPDGHTRGGPPAGTETTVQLLPLPPQPGSAVPPADAPWWDSAQGAPPPPSSGAKRAPAPDLSTYLASTFIAQCPRCGAFRLDIRQARDGWDFRCESCAYTWTWQPGTPWPPVRVRPRGRRGSRPPSP